MELSPVKTINIHQTKTHQAKLVAEASQGDPFIIAEAGKPVVKVIALDAPAAGEVRRLGFMAGHISVPDDFDRMGRQEIERLFAGEK
jgi:antitoxin (DNA-binding transcriptional repressor) of toxin-antitoxin stability system